MLFIISCHCFCVSLCRFYVGLSTYPSFRVYPFFIFASHHLICFTSSCFPLADLIHRFTSSVFWLFVSSFMALPHSFMFVWHVYCNKLFIAPESFFHVLYHLTVHFFTSFVFLCWPICWLPCRVWECGHWSSGFEMRWMHINSERSQNHFLSQCQSKIKWYWKENKIVLSQSV